MKARRQFSECTVLAAALTQAVTSCDFVGPADGERGAGDVITETREISYDDNALDNLVTRGDGATLTVCLDGIINLTDNRVTNQYRSATSPL